MQEMSCKMVLKVYFLVLSLTKLAFGHDQNHTFSPPKKDYLKTHTMSPANMDDLKNRTWSPPYKNDFKNHTMSLPNKDDLKNHTISPHNKDDLKNHTLSPPKNDDLKNLKFSTPNKDDLQNLTLYPPNNDDLQKILSYLMEFNKTHNRTTNKNNYYNYYNYNKLFLMSTFLKDKGMSDDDIETNDFKDIPLKSEVTKETNERREFDLTYKKNLIKKSLFRLEKIAYVLKHLLNVKNNIEHNLGNMTVRYAAQLREHSHLIDSLHLTTDLDKELAYFDLIETSYKLLYHYSKIFLDEVVRENHINASDVDFYDIFLDKIREESLEEKSKQIQFICEEISVCRIYPGFSDHVMEFIDMLLHIPSGRKLIQIVNLFYKYVVPDVLYFKQLMSPKVINIIDAQITKAFHNAKSVKENLFNLYTKISNSFRIYHIVNKDELIKHKARRTLIDVFDKVFDRIGDDIITMEFNNMMKCIVHWVSELSDVPEIIVEHFTGTFLEVIKFHIDDGTRKEIVVLFDVLITGTTDDKNTFKYLFTNGSNLFTGGDIYEYDSYTLK